MKALFSQHKFKILFFSSIFFAVFSVVLILGRDSKTEEEDLEFFSKFPLNDYLYQNQEELKKEEQKENEEKEENSFKQVSQDLKKANEQINALEKELKKKKQEELLQEIQANENLNKLLKDEYYIDENGNLVDSQGKIIKTKEELEREIKKQREGKNQQILIFQNNNKQFELNASKEQQRRIWELASRIQTIKIPKEEEKEDGEIEFGVDSFSNLDKKDVGSNEHKLLRTITADKMIPAILIRPISSQIAGEVTAQVESNIYGAMGRAVLIPKGSKVIGFYRSNNKIGDYRLQVIWTRIITPQGINIMLTKARGADIKGYSGLIGKVYKRQWERYGLPLSLSTLSNGLLIAINSSLNAKAKNNYLNAYSTTQLLNQSKSDISSIIQNIIREQIQIAPIIIIREGSRVFISLTQDIFIPTPKKGETLARFFKEEKENQLQKNQTNDEFDD
ncbi:DNA type IV secretion system protein ComB10 [Helicobacter anatolicus]|uniref:DNA type IV secretion system protein ComB10 n=1 Tax=Helicobacter anatolicus TaxID=2905874 RepID=UPI001E576EDA|nr:DNA type IV secretion system protein ComB10 [Helicobacter anatolicus]MCE3040024.1 DNA type IV secretion system protein ComB10 [Helicobacter anatolicus]